MPASGMSDNRMYDDRLYGRTTILPERPKPRPAACSCNEERGGLLILPAAIVVGSVAYWRRRKRNQK